MATDYDAPRKNEDESESIEALKERVPDKLSGSIDVKTSKNAGVALLCASLLNRGRTTLRSVARIEEVNRLLEVLDSLGVRSAADGDGTASTCW